MNKEEWIEKIYNAYEDGTGEELAEVLKDHPVTDLLRIENAYNEIVSYINFCMSIYVNYWHEKSQSYQATYHVDDINEFDLKKWEVVDFYNKHRFYQDSQVDDQYYKHMLNIFAETEELKFNEQKYGSYEYIFEKLLDGYTYKLS